jgi:hypothetical protein
MLPSYIGNCDTGLAGFRHDPQLLVDGIPSTALTTRIALNTLYIRRHSRMTRLTPSSYLRQHCPVEMGGCSNLRRCCVEVPRVWSVACLSASTAIASVGAQANFGIFFLADDARIGEVHNYCDLLNGTVDNGAITDLWEYL